MCVDKGNGKYISAHYMASFKKSDIQKCSKNWSFAHLMNTIISSFNDAQTADVNKSPLIYCWSVFPGVISSSVQPSYSILNYDYNESYINLLPHRVSCELFNTLVFLHVSCLLLLSRAACWLATKFVILWKYKTENERFPLKFIMKQFPHNYNTSVY